MRSAQAGVTLIELMVALGIAAVVLAVTMPVIAGWAKNQRAKAAARSVGDLLLMARAEAMRTGDRRVVFFGNPGVTDPSGNAVAMGAAWVPVLLINDGAPATANCAIDGGEALEAVQPQDGISWGVSFATAAVATDGGVAPFDPGGTWDGATFADPANAKVNWVLFGPDGIPVTFVGAVGSCGLLGTLGSAGGALYLTNGERDYAVVLSPLGAVRLYLWNRASGAWSS
jgi:prepilin-type N-terminal cleavage/methylation domain-containing protein